MSVHASAGVDRGAPRALRHGLWWAALAVLVVNDHVLKGGGVVPAMLTGKLSDFAGILLAPPLLAHVLPLRNPRARALLAVATVSACFSAINLWPAAAHGLESVWRLLMPGARLWVDATDLAALLLVPLAYRLCLPASAPTRDLGLWLRMRERAALGVAAFACLASAGITDDDDAKDEAPSDFPQVHNATDAPLPLVLSSTEGAGGCELYQNRRVNILTEDAFSAPREIVLAPGARVRLSTGATTRRCGAAFLKLSDGEHEFIYWRDLDAIESFVPLGDSRRAARNARIEGEPGRYRIELGSDLERFTPGESVPETTCELSVARHDLRFGSLPLPQGFLVLDEVIRDADDCLTLRWALPLEDAVSSDAGVEGATQQLCVPAWAFPFDPGELLSVVELPIEPAGRRLRVTRFADDKVDLQLEIWLDAARIEGSLVSSATAQDCFGELTACGAYARPLSIRVRGGDTALQPGDSVTSTEGDARETRILLGPAREVAWTTSRCTGGEGRSGQSASLLELRSY